MRMRGQYMGNTMAMRQYGGLAARIRLYEGIFNNKYKVNQLLNF